MPTRIQRERTKGWKMPENAVSVCRPCKYGNIFKIGDPHPVTKQPMTREDTVACHRTWCLVKISEDPSIFKPLKGKDLACFCRLNEPCHADNYLDYANR